MTRVVSSICVGLLLVIGARPVSAEPRAASKSEPQRSEAAAASPGKSPFAVMGVVGSSWRVGIDASREEPVADPPRRETYKGEGVLTIPKDGSALERIAGTSSLSGGLAADARILYWSDGNNIVSRSKEGGPIKTLAPARHIVTGMDVDDQNVYWTEGSLCHVMKVGKNGGSAVTLASIPDCYTLHDLAVDAKHVYWTSKAAVMRISKTGGKPDVLATGQRWAMGLALDDQYVYWASRDGSTISRRTKAAKGDVVVLAKDQLGPNAVGLDGEYIYWEAIVDRTRSELRRVKKAGGDVQVVHALGQRCGAMSLALEHSAFYLSCWLESGRVVAVTPAHVLTAR